MLEASPTPVVTNSLDRTAHHTQPMYRSANPPAITAPAPVIPGNVRITIGSTDGILRAWYLPKSLLARHSELFAAIFNKKPEIEEINIGADDDHRAFQNFVDYMVSGIYSVHNPLPSYRAIVENLMAYVIGEKLGATTYCDIVIRSLHAIFLPLAKFKKSNIHMSPIRPSDIQFICDYTSVSTYSNPTGIQQLFLDAVASHRSRYDSINVYQDPAWYNLYIDNSLFRAAISNSRGVIDKKRATLLRPVEDYLRPRVNSSGH